MFRPDVNRLRLGHVAELFKVVHAHVCLLGCLDDLAGDESAIAEALDGRDYFDRLFRVDALVDERAYKKENIFFFFAFL